MVLGAAALAVVAGCKDPNYVKRTVPPQNEVKNVPVEPAETTPEVKPVEEQPPAEVTVQEQPVAETVKEDTKPVEPAPEPVYTMYIVQRGDYLAKISKKFNVTLDALRKANPQLKNDKVLLGQKIKLPGKHDVGEQKVPEGAFAKPAPAKKAAADSAAPYSGATEEYVVKSGDTLGGIAHARGIAVRQLKALNGLSGDKIYVGQKLKVPAGKVAAKAEPKPSAEVAPASQPAAPAEPAPEPAESVTVAGEGTVLVPVAETPAPAPVDAADGVSYQVQEGEDVLNLSIRFSLNPSEIRELNNLSPTDELKEGQIIKLPAGTLL